VPEAGARIERTFLQYYGSVGQTLLDAFRNSGGSVVYENRWWWHAGLYSASKGAISIDNENEGIASEELLKALLESISSFDAPEKLKVANALGLESASELNYATVSAFAKPVGQVLNTTRAVMTVLNPGAAIASGVDHIGNKEYVTGALEIVGGVAGATKSLKALEETSPELRALRPTVLQRVPRHHVFPQEERIWFESRGFNIDKYTLELDQGTHSALHTMKWNEEIMKRLSQVEKAKGSTLTESEILDVGKKLISDYKIKEYNFVPFHEP
jgi:hypothetical protein